MRKFEKYKNIEKSKTQKYFYVRIVSAASIMSHSEYRLFRMKENLSNKIYLSALSR